VADLIRLRVLGLSMFNGVAGAGRGCVRSGDLLARSWAVNKLGSSGAHGRRVASRRALGSPVLGLVVPSRPQHNLLNFSSRLGNYVVRIDEQRTKIISLALFIVPNVAETGARPTSREMLEVDGPSLAQTLRQGVAAVLLII